MPYYCGVESDDLHCRQQDSSKLLLAAYLPVVGLTEIAYCKCNLLAVLMRLQRCQPWPPTPLPSTPTQRTLSHNTHPLSLSLSLSHTHTYTQVAALHGELQPMERGAIFEAARNGAYRLLLVSDLAARGIDLPQVCVVLAWSNLEHTVLVCTLGLGLMRHLTMSPSA